ncbi:MAG: ABC-2 family transporter protein [Candidatus Nanohaloarchaea archaeon]|nr:ABC-2 family transporter protein [Candidatus Nanohaloarchaea archaeon]
MGGIADNSAMDEFRRYLRIYTLFFRQFMKTRLVYKTDFLLGFFGQAISLGSSLAFLTLLFTQVQTIHGWTFPEMLFLAGLGGVIMNLHHIFLFNIFNLGKWYIVKGRFDRFLVRPLNPLFHVYADRVSDDNISKFIVNIILVVYAAGQLSVPLFTPVKLVYGFFALVSGVLVFAAIYLVFATTAFWTGKSQSAIWLIFQLSDYRRYPFGIYAVPIQIILTTAIPIAFASFFPATFFLQKGGWGIWQLVALVAGPVLYLLAYRFWLFGLSHYSSTGT